MACRMISMVTRPAEGIAAAPTAAAMAVNLWEEIQDTSEQMPKMWGNLQPSGWVCPKCSVVRSSLQNSNQNVSRNQRNENLANRHVLLHDSNILSGVKSYFIHLCDPDDTNSFVQRCSVHVDRGTQRKDKTTDPLVDSVIFFHTAYGGWQSRSAAEKRSQVSQVYLAQFLQQYNTIRYLYLNIIQYNTIQYNTIPLLFKACSLWGRVQW